MKFLEDDGLRLKQPSSLETLLLDWERVALAHGAGRGPRKVPASVTSERAGQAEGGPPENAWGS